jgi:CDP-diacylglycerol--inositol 3-phosphatidyltransferase
MSKLPPANWPVAWYVPNLIGYVRVITGILSIYYALECPPTAFALYTVSYALDAVDGVAARKLGQTSRWGALLDMLTDRACTAALLSIRALQEWKLAEITALKTSGVVSNWWTVYIFLMVLDVVSHWAQMYRYAYCAL